MIMDETCPSVDVRQFGAKDDGVTDNSAAFQAAVDSLEKTGGTVLVSPGGVFAIGSKVTIRSRQPIWIKSAVVEQQPGGATELKDAERAQIRPLCKMDSMFEWDDADGNEPVAAGGGGIQGMHIAGSVNGTKAADRPRAVNKKTTRSFHVGDCFFDL
jgi:polygalacturonase